MTEILVDAEGAVAHVKEHAGDKERGQGNRLLVKHINFRAKFNTKKSSLLPLMAPNFGALWCSSS
jgi:hypothetical protein